MAFLDHVWEPLPEFDFFKCGVCGLIASTTVVGTNVGVMTPQGWISGERATKLPACRKRSLDDEFGELLSGELSEPPEE